MPKFKKAAVMITAGEGARQWAHKNPEKARSYIDKATSFVDKRTKGKYHNQIDKLGAAAYKGLTGQQGGHTVTSSTVRDGDDTTAPQSGNAPKRPFPDVRA